MNNYTLPFRRVLITGFPRSGTQYMALVLQTLGLDVGHEIIESDGAVGWMYAHHRSYMGREHHPGYGSKSNRLDYEWGSIFHQVRHPLDAIGSYTWLNDSSHAFVDGAVGLLPFQYYDTAQLLPIPNKRIKSDAAKKAAMICTASMWLRWNLLAEYIADWTYRIEDIYEGSPVYDELLRRLNLLQPATFPDVPTDTNHRRREARLTPNDFSEYPWLLKQIDELAQRYGYQTIL